MNFQQPDLPNEGHCLNCNRGIERDELRGGYCIECQDLENADFLALWKGRPKKKTIWLTRYFFRLNKGGTLRALHLEPSRFVPIDWRSLL